MDPNLRNDYSILFKADDIKNSGNVKGSSFEYRLEADSPGKSDNKYFIQRSLTKCEVKMAGYWPIFFQFMEPEQSRGP